jgi:hypothetical protein
MRNRNFMDEGNYFDDEGLLCSLEGGQGSGKSTSLATMGYEDREGLLKIGTDKKIIANSHMNMDMIPNFRFMTLEFLIQNLTGHNNELDSSILLIDEAQKTIDSSARTRESRDILYMLEEIRKRKIQCYISSQRLNKIDLRAREMLDLRGICKTHNEKPCRKCHGDRAEMGAPISYTNPTLYKDEICDRCSGYGKVAHTTVTFKKLTGKNPILVGGLLIDFDGGTIKQLATGESMRWHPSSTFTVGPYRANDYWHLFDTHERMAIQAKKLQHLSTAEVV